MNEEKTTILKMTTDQIESKFGKGSIMKFGDSGKDLTVEAIPTGSLALDAALGIGGVPRGRIIEIYGPESSGKTTLALQILALQDSELSKKLKDFRAKLAADAAASGIDVKF